LCKPILGRDTLQYAPNPVLAEFQNENEKENGNEYFI
jgi:hypothetical protein